jgi:hypothetical protein
MVAMQLAGNNQMAFLLTADCNPGQTAKKARMAAP